jgi:hypothetical protein
MCKLFRIVLQLSALWKLAHGPTKAMQELMHMSSRIESTLIIFDRSFLIIAEDFDLRRVAGNGVTNSIYRWILRHC